MKIGHIELFVKEPLASKEFYETMLGFETVMVQGQAYVWMRSGALEILLRKENSRVSSVYETASHGIVLYTDNLGRTSRELAQRGLQLHKMAGSEKWLAFTDPDGHRFQLVNPNDL